MFLSELEGVKLVAFMKSLVLLMVVAFIIASCSCCISYDLLVLVPLVLEHLIFKLLVLEPLVSAFCPVGGKSALPLEFY